MPDTDNLSIPRNTAPMDEVALIAAIDDSDNRSYGSNLSNLTAQLSAERALNIQLYLGENVDPAPEGQSNVIDRTVFETVQWILPSLCRIFANGDDVVTLQPIADNDVAQAAQESAYLNWLVTNKHPWFEIFLEWATDCLLTKNGYILVYRDNKQTIEIEKYTDQTAQGVSFLLQNTNVQVIDSQEHIAKDLPPEPVMGPQGPLLDANGQPMMMPAKLYDITIRRTGDKKDLCIRVLPPERTKVDQRAFSWRIDEQCNYFEYWEETTLSELREQGYQIPTDLADDPEIYTPEDYARDQFGERRLERYKPSDPSMRRVKARMIWIRVDYDGDGRAELLQILRVGRRILKLEEVSRIPVASGVACPLPHRHIGIAIGDMVSDIQRIKTVILRQGLDNLYLANNPQKVVNEQFVNIDDALISRPGGLIRATDINQIREVETSFVFPQAVQGLQYMDTVRENRTGVNNGFIGIDESTLNSAQPGTVNQMASMAAQRVEQIARVMAFAIEDLFSIIHEQVLKMGHKAETVMLNGQWVEVDPGSWKRRNDFKTCVAFSAGNRDGQIAKLMAMAQRQADALEKGLPVVTPENYYTTLVELTKAADFSSPDRFWTDPKKMQPKPPPPPPPAVVVAQINAQSDEKMKAAELVQQEVESQRKAELDKYAIDVNNGMKVIDDHLQRQHDISMAGVNSTHDAILQSLEAKLGQNAPAAALNGAEGDIRNTGLNVQAVHDALNNVRTHLAKTDALARGPKIIRKNDKGEMEGIDILHPETGAIIASHKAVKDKSGRVIGMQ